MLLATNAWGMSVQCVQSPDGTAPAWAYSFFQPDGGPGMAPQEHWYLNGSEATVKGSWDEGTQVVIGSKKMGCYLTTAYTETANILTPDGLTSVPFNCFEKTYAMNNTDCPPIP